MLLGLDVQVSEGTRFPWSWNYIGGSKLPDVVLGTKSGSMSVAPLVLSMACP